MPMCKEGGVNNWWGKKEQGKKRY